MWALLAMMGGVVGCSQGLVIEVTPIDTGGSTGTVAHDSATSPADSADTADTRDVEEVPGVPDPVARIFALEAVHTLDITLGRALRETLTADPYTHVETDVVFDGVTYGSVGVRQKGRYGSFRTLDEKAGFKIDLNRFVDGQTLDGLTHLNVNNMVQDAAQLHDRVSYGAYRAVGVPAPRVGYAWVTVDGDPYGLYALVEDYDKHFLQEHFEHADGNLYDGDYWLAEDWSTYVLLDFYESRHEYFELDAGTDVGFADIAGITAVLDETSGSVDVDEGLEEVVDLDEIKALWATEIWLGQYDGYFYNENNYRLYFDPADGRATMMPWDHDWAFYADTPIRSPIGRIGAACLGDASCRDRQSEAIDEVCRVTADLDLEDTLDEVTELVNPFVRDDPRREVGWSDVQYYQYDLEDWIDRRCGELRDAGL